MKAVSLPIVKYLIVDEYPASLEQTNEMGEVALHTACKSKAPLDVIEFMVDKHPSVLKKSNKDRM